MSHISYKTIANSADAELKVKGSRFIARARYADSREQAEKTVHEIASEHHDATHNCFAYRLGCNDQAIVRFNDDGEPSGTAGKPILQAITGYDLTNIVVVVTRYFGGTKLGPGGLCRAYGDSTQRVLGKITVLTRYLSQRLRFTHAYEQTGMVDKMISKYNARVHAVTYEKSVDRVLLVRKDLVQAFIDELVERSAATIEIKME